MASLARNFNSGFLSWTWRNKTGLFSRCRNRWQNEMGGGVRPKCRIKSLRIEIRAGLSILNRTFMGDATGWCFCMQSAARSLNWEFRNFLLFGSDLINFYLFAAKRWFFKRKFRHQSNVVLRYESLAAIVAQRLSTRLMTERSWVLVTLGAGLFSLLFLSLYLSLYLSVVCPLSGPSWRSNTSDFPGKMYS